jgi:hypothetical protein
MSAMGQKQTSGNVWMMSALPPKADIAESNRDVRFVPTTDISSVSLVRSLRRCRSSWGGEYP